MNKSNMKQIVTAFALALAVILGALSPQVVMAQTAADESKVTTVAFLGGGSCKADLAISRAAVEELTQEVRTVRSQLAGQGADMDAFQVELAQARGRAETAEHLLGIRTQERDQAEAQVEQLTAESLEFMAKITELEQQLAAVKAEKVTQARQIKDLRDAGAEAVKIAEGYIEANTKLKGELADANDAIAGLKLTIGRKDATISKLEAEKADLQRALVQDDEDDAFLMLIGMSGWGFLGILLLMAAARTVQTAAPVPAMVSARNQVFTREPKFVGPSMKPNPFASTDDVETNREKIPANGSDIVDIKGAAIFRLQALLAQATAEVDTVRNELAELRTSYNTLYESRRILWDRFMARPRPVADGAARVGTALKRVTEAKPSEPSAPFRKTNGIKRPRPSSGMGSMPTSMAIAAAPL